MGWPLGSNDKLQLGSLIASFMRAGTAIVATAKWQLFLASRASLLLTNLSCSVSLHRPAYATMTANESFKRPGAIPFKWEIRPGVPKIQHQLPQPHHSPDHLSSPWSSSSLLLSTEILKPPPPCGSDFLPPSEIRTRSFCSTPRTRSGRRLMEQPVCVSTSGCFSSRYVLKHVSSRSKVSKSERIARNECEVDARSWSSRWSVSPLGEDSPSSRWSSDSSSSPQRFSFTSYRSPGMGSDGLSSMSGRDVEWAGFGLF